MRSNQWVLLILEDWKRRATYCNRKQLWTELAGLSCRETDANPTSDTYHSQGKVVEEVVITLGWDLLVWRRRVDLHLIDDMRVFNTSLRHVSL